MSVLNVMNAASTFQFTGLMLYLKHVSVHMQPKCWFQATSTVFIVLLISLLFAQKQVIAKTKISVSKKHYCLAVCGVFAMYVFLLLQKQKVGNYSYICVLVSFIAFVNAGAQTHQRLHISCSMSTKTVRPCLLYEV